MKHTPDFLLAAFLLPIAACSTEQATDSRSPVAAKERVQASVATASGFALEFTGQQFVIIPNLRFDGTHPLTIEARVIAKDIVPGSSVVANFQNAGVGLEIGRNRTWDFAFHDGLDYKVAVSDSPVKLNQAVHLAGVFDGRDLKLFVNGKLQQKTARTSGRHRPSRYSYLIGADPHTTKPAEKHFTGIIDEVRISASVRYSADFQPAEHLESDDATLALYHFDEGNGETAQDSSSYKRHGMIRGGESWVRPDWALMWNKYQEFLRLLVLAREEAGLSQAELADKIARSTDFVEQLEAGEAKIDVIEFVKITKALDMDPGFLLHQLQK